MLEVVLTLAPLAPELYYVSVPSNHGQVRTGPKGNVGGIDNDFGLDISYQIEDVITHGATISIGLTKITAGCPAGMLIFSSLLITTRSV